MNMHNSNLSILSTDNASATRNSLLFYLQIMQVLQDHYDVPSNTVAISSFILSCRYLNLLLYAPPADLSMGICLLSPRLSLNS